MKKSATGIVMEIDSTAAIIMTGDGEFLKVKKPSSDIEIGQEITSSLLNTGNHTSFIRYTSIAAAILIMLLPFIYLREAYATVAYVSLDINPSLDMGINRFNRVNEIIPLNQEAEILLQDMSLKNRGIDEALHMVFTGAKDKGFIKEDAVNNIDITLVNVKEEKVNISPDTLVKYAEKEVTEISVDASIEINKANKEVHDEARKENLSTSKYLDKTENNKQDSIKIDIKKDAAAKFQDIKVKKQEEKIILPINSLWNKNKNNNDNKDSKDNKNNWNKKTREDKENNNKNSKEDIKNKNKDYRGNLWDKVIRKNDWRHDSKNEKSPKNDNRDNSKNKKTENRDKSEDNRRDNSKNSGKGSKGK